MAQFREPIAILASSRWAATRLGARFRSLFEFGSRLFLVTLGLQQEAQLKVRRGVVWIQLQDMEEGGIRLGRAFWCRGSLQG